MLEFIASVIDALAWEFNGFDPSPGLDWWNAKGNQVWITVHETRE